MEWVWEIYEEYVTKQLERSGIEDPTDEQLESAFIETLSESTVTVLVQEPWKNSVRFKGLARYEASEMFDLLNDPEEFLRERFGGGKFKLNFHRGWNFVATKNFKPDGDPEWQEMPEIEF
jgi:hypothetical protein